MPVTVESVRNIYQRHMVGKTGDAALQEGLAAGSRQFSALIGLTDERGRRNLNENGEPIINPEAPIKLKQLPLGVVSEAILGIGGYNPRTVLESPGSAVAMESVGNTAVQPGAFHNVNAWGSAYGGLLEVKILEEYHKPAFIGDNLYETIPTSQRWERMPGTTLIGDVAEEMTPGQPHPRVQIGERWVDTPKTAKYGLGMDVTREAVFFDPNGNNILRQAGDIGYNLRLRKEKRQLDLFLGLTNTYKYNGTSYNTYLTTGNWINKLASNELVDWTDIDNALNLFANMTDQETGESIAITGPFDLLVMPTKKLTANKIVRDTTVESRTNSAAVVSSGANPTQGSFNGDPMNSPIAYQRLLANSVAEADAKKYWYVGDFKKAFKYMQNFPLNVTKTPATSYIMVDSDLVLSVFATEMGVPAIVEPRYVIQCTG
ncbi:hypothetical protein Pan241w_11280 [Gimesia alba]|uniref:Phage capsid family protein n=1 Tax=Gimesia alba TaxID=2527973 RepID=A0A517RB07_9PLAN|nr:hypothetical protein [Gimesia alba]QDT41069.1 hypothetical protein Pan241w_11280 [Gimesia alba]